ncbi:hypothetical protein RhiirA1_392197 [Rhizophagus irregularis]|uniref:Uncharacterized protein n=1 Tax=Rhizophagus irregularis TaxID=588596 RepID=A0A2N0S191_9GLOM|nr:hypothetical protein RhiirA1_392197 [Rhizophagus irregularis]
MDLIPFLFRITIFILSFLYMIPLNEAAPTHSSPYDAITEFHIVFVIPITFHSINIIGTLFIFYRTYLRWKRDHRSIVLSLRFPFYLAITDFLYSSSDLINYSYSASNKSKFLNNEVITLPSPLCEIMGFSVVLFVSFDMLLIQNFIIGVIVSSAISLGGIGNVIQYICNEGFRYQSSSVTCSDYKSEAKAEADDEQKSNDDSIITNNV